MGMWEKYLEEREECYISWYKRFEKREKMTNWKKYREAFIKLGFNPDDKNDIIKHLSVKEDGTLKLCKSGECFDCIFMNSFENCYYLVSKWLDKEEKKVNTDKKKKKTPPRIVAYQDGNTITVKDLETGKTASAVCSKKDTFDFYTGFFIAASRLTELDIDLKVMRLEIEQAEGYLADTKMRIGALMGEGYKWPYKEEKV